MDSLLATYASSDEEEENQQQQQSHHHQKNPNQIQSKPFPSLPPPKQTLTPNNPPPSKSSHPESRSGSKSLFSRLPQPKSERSDPFSLNPKPKKVIQFRPPIISKIEHEEEEEEDDDHKEKQRIKEEFIPQAPSVKSFLSSIPAPRNSGSLGALPSSSGTGRRSILEAGGLSNSKSVPDNKSLDNNNNNPIKSESSSSYVNYDDNNNNNTYDANVVGSDVAATSADYGSYDYGNYDTTYANVEMNGSSYGPVLPESGGGYGGGYEDYGGHGGYESKWIDRSSGDLGPEVSVPIVENVGRVSGKRGRNEILPQDVIEVSQDELMKNRPREDQVKMTGIAFGPAYQPASSAKGKPTKLHKRKHQIGSLYFDMRSKEMELAERRSKGFLTKAETQAKYGW